MIQKNRRKRVRLVNLAKKIRRKMKKQNAIELMTILFIVGIIIGNTIVNRTFQIGNTGWFITSAFVFFAGIMVISDILVELVGKKQFTRIVLYGFGTNLLVAVVYTIVTHLPTNDAFTTDAYNLVLGQSLPIVIMSLVAFVASNFANAGVMWAMKARHGQKHFKLRAWLSTLAGQFVDNSIFFILGLGVVVGIPMHIVLTVFVTNCIFEIAEESLLLPVTHKLVKVIQRLPE